MTLEHFKRALGAGHSSLPFSGRYRRKGKPATLPPGSYRLTAVPTDAAGKTGKPARAAFSVVR